MLLPDPRQSCPAYKATQLIPHDRSLAAITMAQIHARSSLDCLILPSVVTPQVSLLAQSVMLCLFLYKLAASGGSIGYRTC